MEVARLTTVLDSQTDNLIGGLRRAETAGQAFALGMTAALASVGAAAIKVGLVMDDALDTIRIRTGQTGKALEGLGGSFRDVFRAGPDAAQDVSDALSTLRSRTGQAGDGLEALATQVLTLSRITKTDLNSNVSDSARLFASWGIAVADQGKTLDTVFRTYQQTGVAVDTLLGKLVTAGPTFRAAGFDFATSAALLGGFEQAGVSAERVISGLSRAFNFFSKKQVDASTGIRDTIARIRELGPGAESAALGVTVFGRGAVDMVAAIQSGRLNVDALVASISTGTDTIEAAAKATDEFSENLAIMGKRVFLALEPLGTGILETFNRGLLAALNPTDGLRVALHRLAQAGIIVAAVYAGRLAPVLLRTVHVYTALTVRTVAHTVAMIRNAGAAGLLSSAMGGLRAALAFLGGPLGLAVTVAAAAIGIAFLNAGRRARQAAADARQAADDFAAALGRMDEATFSATAAHERSAFRALEGQAARAASVVEQQQALVNRLSREAGIDRFGEVRMTPELQAAEERLRRNRDIVADIDRRWRSAAANVRAVREQESALAAANVMGPEGPTGTGPLPWEGDDGDATERWGRSLRSEVAKTLERLQTGLNAVKFGTLDQRLNAIAGRLRSATVFSAGAQREREATAEKLARVASDISAATKQRAEDIQAALVQGAQEASAQLQQASENLRGVFAGFREQLAGALPGPLAEFANIARSVAAARNQKVLAAQNAGVAPSGLGLAPAPAAAAMIVAMEFLAGVAETLGPALEALLLPVRLLGESFGRALVPIVRALFPVFRDMAIAATYVGEVFFRVAGGIAITIGKLVLGLGKLINKLPGSLGNPLISFGETLVDLGRGFRSGADELERARDELKGLTFDDAIKKVDESADRLAESLSNVPPLFDLALRRMQAGRSTAGASTPSPAPSPRPSVPGSGGGSGQPVNVYVTNTYQIDGRGAASDRELLRLIREDHARTLRGGDNDLKNAVRDAALSVR